MSGAPAVGFVAVLVAGSGVILLVLAFGLWLAERLLASEDPDPLEEEVFGKQHVRRQRRTEWKESPSGRLTRVGALLVAGGVAAVAALELLDRIV